MVRSLPTLSVKDAAVLCTQHPPAQYRTAIRGFFVSRDTHGRSDEGAVFSSIEVPLSAAYYGNWGRYGGLGVLVAPQVFGRRGFKDIPDVTWVRLQGLLQCVYRPAAIEVYSWQPARPPREERIPSIKGVLTVDGARKLCSQHRVSRYRASVRGLFTRTLALYPNSGMIGDLAALASAGHLPSGVVPNHAWVVLHGLLACNVYPPEIEIYSWERERG